MSLHFPIRTWKAYRTLLQHRHIKFPQTACSECTEMHLHPKETCCADLFMDENGKESRSSCLSHYKWLPSLLELLKNREAKHWRLPRSLSSPAASFSQLMFKISGGYDLTLIFLNASNHAAAHSKVARTQTACHRHTSSPQTLRSPLKCTKQNKANRHTDRHTHTRTQRACSCI